MNSNAVEWKSNWNTQNFIFLATYFEMFFENKTNIRSLFKIQGY